MQIGQYGRNFGCFCANFKELLKKIKIGALRELNAAGYEIS
jgi:hypothetical protein